MFHAEQKITMKFFCQLEVIEIARFKDTAESEIIHIVVYTRVFVEHDLKGM